MALVGLVCSQAFDPGSRSWSWTVLSDLLRICLQLFWTRSPSNLTSALLSLLFVGEKP